MSTLDLTDAVHTQKMPCSWDTRTRWGAFVARFDYCYQALSVLTTETSPGVWTVSTFPGLPVIVAGQVAAADNQYSAPNTYTVSGAEATALSNAGYEVT